MVPCHSLLQPADTTYPAAPLPADDAIAKWRSLLGPTDSQQARQQAPGSIRASFGTNKTFNAAHGSDAPETAAQEISFFFGQGAGSVGKCDLSQGTVLGLLKPHLMAEGCAGLLLDAAMEAVDVAALQMFQLDRAAAADFLEVGLHACMHA
jgi:nucleoside-diphosphate kinase